MPDTVAESVCIDGWARCPLVGVDWPALFSLAEEADADALRTCNATALLSLQRVPGMHALCVLQPGASAPPQVAATLAVYVDMQKTPQEAPEPTALIHVPRGLTKLSELLALLEYRLKLRVRRGKYQRQALFTDTGIRVQRIGGALRAHDAPLLLLEGGQWLWPPVQVGHERVLPGLTSPGSTTRVVTLSMRPLVIEVEDFLSQHEAEHIIARASRHMAKSGVQLKDVDKGKAAKEFRTSSQYFLPTRDDSRLEAIDARVMKLTRIPISHAEEIQVLRYNHMEHYSAHHDFFDPAAYKSDPAMLRTVEHGAKNRLATVFFYLNNVSAGGQTNFPRAATPEQPFGGRVPRDFFDCSRGLSVYPQMGKVIIFYSMLPSGDLDDYSLHGGCDVLDPTATKWSANFWLWNKPNHFNSRSRQRQTEELQAEWI